MKSKKIITFILLLAFCFILASCTKADTYEIKEENTNNVSEKESIDKESIEGQKENSVNKEEDTDNNRNLNNPKENYNAIETDGIILDNGKIVKSREQIKAPIVIDYFYDPACPSCFKSSSELISLDNKVRNGELAIIFRPVPFLNDKTIGDFSNRASSYTRAVAEYTDYDKLLNFLSEVSSKSFQEKVSEEFIDDKEFIKAMKRAGISQNEIELIEENKENFVGVSIAAAQEFTSQNSSWKKFSSVQDKNGNFIVYAPFILVNENGEMTAKSLNKDNIVEYIEYKMKK